MRVLVVSPHFDDAPLSLGQSLIDGELRAHRVTVGIVFGRTNWLRFLHPTRRRAPIAGAIRRSEEQWASARFHYRVRVAKLEEVVLRLGTIDTGIYLDPTFDAAAAPELPAAIAAIEPWAREADRVMVPLGMGGHLDHLLCAEAGRVLARDQGTAVSFYEDRPYASFCSDEEIALRAAAIDPSLQPVDVSGPISLEKRRRLFYPSQIDANFERAMQLDTDDGRRERVWVDPATGWPR